MYGKFLVEGHKTVMELMDSSFKIDAIYALELWGLNNHVAAETITSKELEQISTHENPNQVIAIVDIPDFENVPTSIKGLNLVCDGLNDPGNAGAIIRIADWFGVSAIYFSENSVEVFNPKVVSSAKGSLFRMPIYYTDLKKLFQENKQLPVYGTFMKGENIYKATLQKDGFILIGNEANGISDELKSLVTFPITIPSFGNTESLNAAVAAGIIVSEFKRRVDFSI